MRRLLEGSETFLVYLLISPVLWGMWKLKTSRGLHRQTRLEMRAGVGAFSTGLPCSEPFPLFQISVAEVQLLQEGGGSLFVKEQMAAVGWGALATLHALPGLSWQVH